jgi:signal transduction histidine kinase
LGSATAQSYRSKKASVQQLRETNLELWRTTRRMNELGRLAAAGQTAAHFAHEVGTPLNLISGHVQLLKSDLERDPRDAETRIKTISAQIERIERIVRRMQRISNST